MTMAEQLENIGMQKGMEKGRHDIALNLVDIGLSDEDILKATKLSSSDLAKIKQEQLTH